MASASFVRFGPLDADAVSALPAALPIASGVQGGGVHPPADEAALLVILIGALTIGCLFVGLYLRARARRPHPVVEDQWQALAVMGELCPDGWQAQITLYGWGAPVPDDAPPSRVPLVELEWKQFAPETAGVVVARRVWAPTISDALQLMVQDRQTDITLEEIEQAAGGDGNSPWSE